MADEATVISQFVALLPGASSGGRALSSLILATISKPGFLGFPSVLLLLRSSGCVIGSDGIDAVDLLISFATGNIRSACINVCINSINDIGLYNLLTASLVVKLQQYIMKGLGYPNPKHVPLQYIVDTINEEVRNTIAATRMNELGLLSLDTCEKVRKEKKKKERERDFSPCASNIFLN